MSLNSPHMNVMVKAAEKAARVLVRDFGEVEQLQVAKKGPADFVTAADRRSEEIIFEELKAARPDYSFLLEESGRVEGKNQDYVWIVDPIDGTKNFMHGFPHWSISIALEEKGKVIAGLVYDPVKDEMFMAEHGKGAFSRRKRLRVSERSGAEDAFVIVSGCKRTLSKNKEGLDLYFAELRNVVETFPAFRKTSCLSLDMCYVAAGRCDGCYEYNVKPWDMAAAQLILKEAGGFVASIDKDENPVYAKSVFGGNAPVYEKLKKILRG